MKERCFRDEACLHQEVFVGGVCTKMFRVVTVPAPFIMIILVEPTQLKIRVYLVWREKSGRLHDVLCVV